jgi:hypothetical protein
METHRDRKRSTKQEEKGKQATKTEYEENKKEISQHKPQHEMCTTDECVLTENANN